MHDSTDSANNVVSMSEDFRTLDVPYSEQVLGCVGDAWVRTVHFSAPRYCDGTDVSGYAFTVHFENERGDNDFYTVDDLTVGTNELTFTWLVSPIATAYEGMTGVSVVATDVDAGTGEVEHRISSETFAWRVLPATYSNGYEFIEQETVVEAQIAIWQAQIDAALSVYDEIIPVSAFSSANTVKDAIDKCDKSYETVADMQDDESLEAGMITHTLGFHSAGDGGAAWYKVESTGTANGMDVIALDNGLYALLKVDRNTVNVLQLGAKNNESDSCSSIVNAMTAKYNLYFPAGIYVVDATLVPQHAMYGDTYARIEYGNYETQSSILKSSITGSNPVVRLEASLVTVHDICIKCNSTNDGIMVKDRACLYNIWIWNLSGTGIYVNPDVGRSRCLYADNISIEGATGFPTSVGITVNANAYDSRFTNLEIMRVQRGIVLYTIAFFTNVHLWGGSYGNGDTQPDTTWQDTSKGIELKSSNSSVPRFIGTNVYIDTFRMLISASNDYAVCEITNLTALSDSTITWDYVVPLFYTNGTMAILKVNGGFIRFNNYFNIIGVINEPSRVEINNVTYDDQSTSILDDYSYRGRILYPECKQFKFYSPSENHRGKYLPLAVINTPLNAVFDVSCGMYEQFFNLHVVTSSTTATVTMTAHNSTIGNSLYYYYNGVYLTIYTLGGSTAGNWPLSIQIVSPYTNARLLDRSSMINALFNYFYKSSDSLPAGATQITYN